jgi:hypothetical protein
MPWPVHPNGLLGAQGDSDSYRIERSLRFNTADSAHLSRTPASTGNRKTWTFSVWVKRSSIGSAVAGDIIGSAVAPSGTSGLYFRFNSDYITFGDYGTSGWDWLVETSDLFRDPSAWYHLVAQFDTTQATSADRVKIYVNGSRVTSLRTTTYPSLNLDGRFNQASIQASIGRLGTYAGDYFGGYMAEINFIDGQALTPSSFGETDAITGRWKAKAFSGTYGTNGFYLKFADNSGTTATTLGKDSSPNGNNWTPNNFVVSPVNSAGNDSLVDSPTNYGSDTGVGGETRGNYCTLNPLFGTTNTIQDGNLVLTGTAASTSQRVGTMAVSSGKWYYETTLTTLPSAQDPLVGFTEINNTSAVSQYPGQSSSSYAIYQISTNTYLKKLNAGSFTDTNTTVASQGDILGVALDLTSGKIWFSKNGAWVDSGDPATGANAQFTGLSGTFVPAVRGTGQVATTTISCNFGQRPFIYAAPTGFKALCTTNLPTPTIKKSNQYVDASIYTGTGATQSVTNGGFQPDFLWIKTRSTSASNTSNQTFNSVAGHGKVLYTDLTNAEFDSGTAWYTPSANGFSLTSSAQLNNNTTTYVAWSWKEASIAGFDIVSFTAPASGSSTVSHNLGIAPKVIIAKSRSSAVNWTVYHASVTSKDQYLLLNGTNALTTLTDIWGTSAPSSSVFGFNVNNQGASANVIAYLFAEIEGYSKFGSYTGNASTDGPFICCGFRPKFIIVKRTDTAGEPWIIKDTTRSSYNGNDVELYANTSGAEGGPYSPPIMDYVSNGFKLRSTATGSNASGATYIFMAFAESPFKYARAR